MSRNFIEVTFLGGVYVKICRKHISIFQRRYLFLQVKINVDFLASLDEEEENDEISKPSKDPVPKTNDISKKPVPRTVGPYHPTCIVPPPASKSAYELEREKRIQVLFLIMIFILFMSLHFYLVN